MDKIEYINPKELVFYKNSRWRIEGEDLKELMESVKQIGILLPILARKEDNTIICGNRRAVSAIKLGLEKVQVIYKTDVTDEELLLINLAENIQRKNISSIEIGRMCEILTSEKEEFKLTIGEVAVRLGVSESRVRTCLQAFRRLPIGERKHLIHLESSRKRKYGDLPESVFDAIIKLPYNFSSITDDELNLIIKEARNRKLTVSQINLIGWFLIKGASVSEALEKLDKYKIARVNLIMKKTELSDVREREGISGLSDLTHHLIKKYSPYKKLIF